MKNKHSYLRRKLLEDLLEERVEEYENFSRNSSCISKRKHRQLIPLWRFLLHLLHRDVDSAFVEWSDRNLLHFQIKDTKSVAELWGSMKNKSDMTYEKLGRAMRYYYGKGIIEKVSGKRYFYKFLLSRKTKKYISQFVELDETTGYKARTIPCSPSKADGIVANDDSVSVSSSMSNESDASSIHSIPDKFQVFSDEEDKEVEVEEQDELPNFSTSLSPEKMSVAPVCVPTTTKPLPTKPSQLKKDENQMNKIRKSNICLLPAKSNRVSAFHPPDKSKPDNTSRATMQGYDRLDKHMADSKRRIFPYHVFKRQFMSVCNSQISTMVYAIKMEPHEVFENVQKEKTKIIDFDDHHLDGIMKSNESLKNVAKVNSDILKAGKTEQELSSSCDNSCELQHLSSQSTATEILEVQKGENGYWDNFHHNNSCEIGSMNGGLTAKVSDGNLTLRHKDPFMGCADNKDELSINLLRSYSTFDDAY